MRTLPRTLCLFVFAGLAQAAWASHRPDWGQLVARLEIAGADGAIELASAVPLGGGTLVTNCHAVREARRIWVSSGGTNWLARLRNGDAYRDLCYLDAPGFPAQAVAKANASDAKVGMPVYAAGYTNGDFAIQSGYIQGLHTCPCANGRVIQTSAAFDRGASGGGLFDSRGRLLGILTFKSPTGGDYHFALPVDWVSASADENPGPPRPSQTFWERGGEERMYFLAACALGAKQSWQPLDSLAAEWTVHEPGNPEAWMALGRAKTGLGEAEAAATAFQSVLRLDASHDGAVWELQKLEFDLDRSLLTP